MELTLSLVNVGISKNNYNLVYEENISVLYWEYYALASGHSGDIEMEGTNRRLLKLVRRPMHQWSKVKILQWPSKIGGTCPYSANTTTGEPDAYVLVYSYTLG